MSFKEEHLKNKFGKIPERRKKVEALLEKVVSEINEAGLTIVEVKVFCKVLEEELAEYKEQLLKTVPFVILPDNLQELPYNDQLTQLVNRLSEVQPGHVQAHISDEA